MTTLRRLFDLFWIPCCAISMLMQTRALLDMATGDPVLLLRRRTWSRGMIASSARLLHPGTRFSLAVRMRIAR